MRRRSVRGCINQILTVSERDRGQRSAAFQRLSLYLLWQFPRCSGPPGHCVCRCLSVSPENTSQVDQSPPQNASFWTGQGQTASPFRSPQRFLLTNHSASLQLTRTARRFSRVGKKNVFLNAKVFRNKQLWLLTKGPCLVLNCAHSFWNTTTQ